MLNDVLGFPESASVPNVATVTQTSNEMGMTSSLTPPGKTAHGLSYSAEKVPETFRESGTRPLVRHCRFDLLWPR